MGFGHLSVTPPPTRPKQLQQAVRLVKERVMHEKEAKQEEEKIEKMKAEDGENYAIKKQVKPTLTKNWDNSDGGRAGAVHCDRSLHLQAREWLW